MKKHVFIIPFFLFFFLLHLKGQESTSILIQSDVLESNEISIIGLATANVSITNNSKENLTIDSPKNIAIFTDIIDRKQHATFNEGNLRFSSGPQTVVVEPGKTLIYKINVNIFEMLKYISIDSFVESKNITLYFGIYCYDDNRKYYSKQMHLKVTPMSSIDKETFLHIKNSGFAPFEFSKKGTITGFGINESISDSVLTKYPKSTFAELAGLSLAYQLAKKYKANPALKDQINQLLEKPLISKYSFVRYLAEELKKKL